MAADVQQAANFKAARIMKAKTLNGVGRGSRIVALAVCIFCFGFAQPVRAEVRVSGTADAVVIETRGATLDEVLKALQNSEKFRYYSDGALEGAVSGTYSGPLRRVVARLLDGHNYVFRHSPNDLEVVIFGSGEPTQAGQSPQAGGPSPPRDCRYNDGVRIIAVEC
jgi:hypothetical protein